MDHSGSGPVHAPMSYMGRDLNQVSLRAGGSVTYHPEPDETVTKGSSGIGFMELSS